MHRPGLYAVLATVTLWALFARASWPQSVPINCTFPTRTDTLLAKEPNEVITSADINQMRCILNALQTRALATAGAERVCSVATVAKGARIPVTLTAGSLIPLGSAVQATVRDTGSPAALTADAEDPVSPSVTVWVWNHHPDEARTGTVCLTITRP